MSVHTEESLDPNDWDAMRALAHRAVDDALDYLANRREQPVWRATPPAVLENFKAPAPRAPQGAERAYQDYRQWIEPWQMGNTHPRFWGWYMGAGTAFGALGDFLAATLNPNCGGGSHVAGQVESQVVDWCREFIGMPDGTAGLLVSGGSMANLVGLAVARTAHAPIDVRTEGIASLPRALVFYASAEAHSCTQKALELMGHGSRALRTVPTDANFCMRTEVLSDMIAEDRRAGLQPCAVVATAGTTNTGAVDDLTTLASICRREQLWFHVDGAIGAAVTLSKTHRSLVAGIELADSLALDLHKWLQVPFEAGCVLVRDRDLHRSTFSVTPAYLKHLARGLAGDGVWFSDYGIQLSRSFRALKIWLSIKEHGLDKYGRLVDQNIAQARALADLVNAQSELELLGPAGLNIVCLRYVPAEASDAAANALNEELLIRLHESGIAVPSYTTLRGRYWLRVAISNHRTRHADLALFVEAVLSTGRALAAALGTHPTQAVAD
jgi:glutamate/tyrosine decarboxylase-like PLP-dependent enzyme